MIIILLYQIVINKLNVSFLIFLSSFVFLPNGSFSSGCLKDVFADR